MPPKYVSVPRKFDSEKWANLIVQLVAMFETVKEAATMTETSDTALHTWMRENFSGEFRYPNMTNFLRICNLMDVDPADFFTWEE